MSSRHPGKDGDSVPTGTLVFRIAKNVYLSPHALAQRRALPEMFELSSADKASPGKRLSVWVEELTIADQAWDFMGAKPDSTVVACLEVGQIEAISPQPSFTPLRVEWEQALMDDGSGNKVPNTKPGAEGHAGIAGLKQGGNGKTDTNFRKALRSAVADIADISPVPVPHDISEDDLRYAAYFSYENQIPKYAPSEVHWMNAVRQLRRARVRQHRMNGTAGSLHTVH